MQPIVHSNYGFQLQKQFDSCMEIWIDNFELSSTNSDKKIFIAVEPNEIVGFNNYIKQQKNKYDYILTYEEELLKELSNAVLFEYGTCWIDMDKYIFPEKKFNISFVCGDKNFTKGHVLRQKIWFKQSKIQTPTNFFISSRISTTNSNPIPSLNNNPVLYEYKEPLFESMFHICIENISKKYYFSEKLIDCLLTKTIPIYNGCTNIGDYFNLDGFYTFNTIDELLNICNSIKEEDYLSKKDAIEENFEKAKTWINHPERIYNKLIELGIR